MDKMISRFPEQIGEAINISENINTRGINPDKIQNILVAGLGGSGIGGNFVQHFLRDQLPVPFEVSKSYDIPHFVSENSLVIISSYSGNTEETISSYKKAREAGAQIFIISSGGKLIEEAKKNQIDYIQLPDDWDSPRACLGYSFIQQLGLLHKLGYIGEDFIEQLTSAQSLLESDMENIQSKAEMLAGFVYEKTAVIYSSDQYEPIAIRWRQQINENAKDLCWHHVLPEMNHNELVGWRDQRNDLAVIMLRNMDDHPRTQVRMNITKEIISNYTSTFIEIKSKGSSMIERALYLVHLGDWMSYYLSQKRNHDSIEVKVIDFLKSQLAKH